MRTTEPEARSGTEPASPGSTRRRSPWATLAVLAIAQFMVVLDVTIVNVALPDIQSRPRFSADGLQWVISAYTLVFGGFLLLGGRAADLLGRRRIFVTGLVALRRRVTGRRPRRPRRACSSAPAPSRASAARCCRPPRCRILTVTFAARPGAQHRDGRLGRPRRARRHPRRGRRWHARRLARLELGLLRQRADRGRPASSLTPVFVRAQPGRSAGRRTFDIAGAVLGTGGAARAWSSA